MEGGEWRNSIINQLQARNKCQTTAFQEIITFQSRLFDNVNTLKNENLQLTLVNERIRFSSTDNAVSGTGGASNERVQALEQKILVQQEELTNLHRRRGESAQQIISLNAKVHDLEKQLQAKDIIISENTALIASLRAEIQLYGNNKAELELLNTVLRDEHQALQIAFAAIEEKLRKAQDENRALVERLIKYKSKDADKMNEENEHFLKSSPTAFLINTFGRVSFGKKSDRVRRELEEAAREGGSRGSIGSAGSSAEDKIMDSLPFYATMLPTKVALRFDAHDVDVNAVKWSPTERTVATGGEDRKVKLWDVSKMGTVEPKGTLVGSNKGVMSVDYDSTGAFIVGASNDFASRVWSVGDQRLRHTLTGHSGKVMAAKFLGEPTKVITGSHDRTLKIWDLRSKMCTETKFAGSSCNDLVTSDGAGSTIISGHFDKRIRFWDIRNEMCANHIMLQGKVTSLDLSRDTDNEELKFKLNYLRSEIPNFVSAELLEAWEVTHEYRKKELIETPGNLWDYLTLYKSLTIPNIGPTLVKKDFELLYGKGEAAGTSKLREFLHSKRPELVKLAEKLQLAAHIQRNKLKTFLELAIQDSNYLLACVRDDTIQLIDLRMNTIVRSFSHEAFKVGCDWSRAAFGPAGRLLAVGGADGAVFVWNTISGKLEATLRDHSAAVTAVSWHPQSGLLASVDRGKRAVIWGDL